MSIKERVDMFHIQFPDKVIAATTLQRLYAQHKIRRKNIRIVKSPPVNRHQDFEN